MTRNTSLSTFCAVCALATTLPAQSSAAASPTADEAIVLETFNVSASQDRGYYAPNSISGSRVNEPIKNVPLSISVVTPELLSDLDADRYDSALRFMSSYNADNGRIRGLTAFTNNRNSAGIDGELETTGIDRVEVVKGPSTLMYGVTAAGGQVNAVSKRANLTRNRYIGDVQVGSEDRLRLRADLNQVIIPRVLGTRLSAKTERYGSSTLDTARREADFLQWTTTYRPFRNTALTLEVESNRPTLSVGPTLPTESNAAGQPNSVIPFAVLYGAPEEWDVFGGTARRTEEHTIWRFDWEQRWLPGLDTIVSLNHQDRPRETDAPSTSLTNVDVNGDGIIDRAMRVNWRRADYTIDSRTYEAMAKYTFDTGPVTHGLLLRYQQRQYDDRSLTFRSAPASDTFLRLSGITDWSNHHAHRPANLAYDQVFKNSGMWDNTSDLRQHSASYMPAFKTDHGTYRVTYGVIRSKQVKTDGRPFAESTWLLPDPLTPAQIEPAGGYVKILATDVQEGTTTLAAASYAPNDTFTFYTVVTGSFRPTATRNSFQELLPPRRGKTTEWGVKFDNVLGNRISGSLSFYDTSELNNAKTDPNIPRNTSLATDGLPLYTFDPATNRWTQRPGTTFDPNGPKGDTVAVGRYDSTGWDAELFLTPVANTQIVLSYTYINASVVQDTDPRQIGRIDPNTARHTIGAFGKYRFNEGRLRGLQFTAGYRWSSEKVDQYLVINGANVMYSREGDNVFALGARYDFKVGNRLRPFAQLNVDNLFAPDRLVGNRSGTTERFKFDSPATWKLMTGLEF